MSQLKVVDGAASSSDNLDNEGVCQPGNENTGRWTSDEHRLFLRGLELHGKGWKQIATLIQTRTVVQIRTHAQKYFQKLSKAQASGTSHLDPATLMSTMDAGKPRPASVSRNLRSSTMANSAAESEGRLRSLRKRRNRGRHPRRSVSSGSSGGGGGSSESEEEDGEGGYRGTTPGTTTTTMMMMVRQAEEAPAFTVGGGKSSGAHGAEFDEEEAGEKELDESVDIEGHNNNNRGLSSSLLHGGTAAAAAGTWRKRRPAKSHRSSPTKASKAAAIAAAGGAADARALAWEAAAAKAAAGEEDEEAAAADGVVGGFAGMKRYRSESVSSSSNDSSLGKTIKSLKRTTGSSQTTRISPTSVADVNFMSFPVPQTEHSEMVMHHLPQQLAPSWCTKPQDAWMAGAGLDMGGLDADDAGPFRWFIDERSLSAPGAFFQPPVETWSGSDTTDVSTSAGSDHQHHRTVVPEQLPSSTNKVDMSPGGVLTSDNSHNQEDVSSAKHRGMMEPMVPSPAIDHQADVPISDAAMASEVSRHVEADNATACAAAAAGCAGGASGGGGDGGHSLDITSGLWLDHPQEAHEAGASPLMYGLGLSAPANTGGAGGGGGAGGLGGGLSLPSLDEEEVLGFLACAEENSRQAAAAAGGDAEENDLVV
ncbi:unnamed protein product [Ectocarpus sp. CCAP 1310/34]|nr:unnamed protein product [Ectocarpus sp. CCAP 1310/34]